MSLKAAQSRRLRNILFKWDATPYVGGQQVPQQGVDCVRLCDAVMVDVLDLDLPPLPRNAQDAAYHSKDVVQATTRLLFERFDLYSVPTDNKIMPLDLIVCQQKIRPGEETPADADGHHIAIALMGNLICDAWPGKGFRVMGVGGLQSSFHVLKIWRTRHAYAKST